MAATAGEPSLVQRLDRDDDYYYVVPFHIGTRETARLIVDGRTGAFTQGGGVESEGQSLTPWVAPASLLADRAGRSFDLPHVKERIVQPGTVGQHPVLVWKPCHQSSSPLMPFYQLSVGDQFVYLRVDGILFEALTVGPA